MSPAEENTLADSIAVGVPGNPVKALNAVKYSGGARITVTDQEILAAMKTLGSAEGVFGEPAGVAGLAGLMKAVTKGLIKHRERTATIATGNGLKDIQNALKAAGEPFRIQADFRELEKIFSAPYEESVSRCHCEGVKRIEAMPWRYRDCRRAMLIS